MAAKELLAATTDADQSKDFYVNKDNVVTVMVSPDLATTETADIQISHDDGKTWADYIDGSAIELTLTRNTVRLYGPMLYRVDKDATAGATGVYLHFLEQ